MATTPLKYLNQYFTTTLNVGGGLDNSQTTGIVIQAVSGLDIAKPGVACLTYADPINTSTAEWITYTSINGSNELQGVVRGAEGFGAKTHSNGAVVAFPLSESHINDINAMFDSTGLDIAQIDTPASPSSGRNKLYFKSDDKAYTLTSAGVEAGVGITAADLATAGNEPFTNHSLSRQALINGNFDVWQRGTSIALTTTNDYTADRWYAETATAGTDKTISRQDGTGVAGSYYCARVAIVQDVDELVTFSQALESQDSIKLRGQKVTLSFYARGGAEFVASNATLVSKIVTGKGTDQKVLAFTTSADGVSQNNTLTTSWVKFTCTTTAAIASDITQLGISFAFTHAGAGVTTNYFEVTQVQLCAGSVALPFQPKSFEEELRACQRYYIQFGGGSLYESLAICQNAAGGNLAFCLLWTPVQMRIIPAVTTTGNIALTDSGGNPTNITSIDTPYGSGNIINLNVNRTGLTASALNRLFTNNTTAARLMFSAEL